MKLRLVYHLLFWGFFTLLFLKENPNADVQDHISWIVVLSISAIVVYTNLYLLLPKLFFKKKYINYVLVISATVFLGAKSLLLILPPDNTYFDVSLFNHIINLSFFVIITSSLKFLREFHKKQELLIKSENEQLKTDLSLLKAQVNPHFLFNTLNNLYGLITQNQNQKASDITLKLSDLMRYLLESSKTEHVSLQKEVKFIEDYLDLEKIRLSQKTDIKFEISGFEKEIFIAPLLFIPLVENAFKHGLHSVSNNNFAYFSLSIQGREIYFEAKNSVSKKITVEEKSGTGLENLRKRLELIYPQKHFLEIEDNKDNFKVILQIIV
jgi:LytS/YehU family sensor histidine kinase